MRAPLIASLFAPAALLALLALAAMPARAEVAAAAPDHMALRQAATSDAPPAEVWALLIRPADWWSSEHTYWGDAAALSLDLAVGGAWAERSGLGGAEHGRVLFWRDAETLRLAAPFGPLQGMAVDAVWTITLAPDGEGTRITSDFVANGAAASGLDRLAPAVDGVFTEAIDALAKRSAR